MRKTVQILIKQLNSFTSLTSIKSSIIIFSFITSFFLYVAKAFDSLAFKETNSPESVFQGFGRMKCNVNC